jgi:hypothetical protein
VNAVVEMGSYQTGSGYHERYLAVDLEQTTEIDAVFIFD